MHRNFDKIQFEDLRKDIDPKYNNLHDELTDCYYKKISFRNYGILTKEQFDKLHGLIFLHRDIEFHDKNLERPKEKQYDEKKYNNVMDKKGDIIYKKTNKAMEKIQSLKKEGIALNI